MSSVLTFSRGGGIHSIPATSDWAQHKQSNDDRTAEVFQRVAPGANLDPAKDHVVVVPSEVSSKADSHIGDLVYFTNESLAQELNNFFRKKKAPFGPFLYPSEVATKLRQLQWTKPNKAAELKGYLDAFAAEQGFNVDAFEQWDAVMYAKDRRDLLKLRAESLSFLKSLLSDPSSCIASYKDAVQALVTFAEKKGLR